MEGLENVLKEIPCCNRILKPLLELDSLEKFRRFIHMSLAKGKDEYLLGSCMDDSSDGPIRQFYHYANGALGEINNSTINANEKENAKTLLETRIEQFENAALSLIADRKIFFEREYGYEKRPDLNIGGQIISCLQNCHYPSQDKISGKFAEKVMPHIEYWSILSGDINFGSGKRYEHNKELLSLLKCSQTQTIPGADYWKKLSENEAFVWYTYQGLKELNDKSYIDFLPSVVKGRIKLLKSLGRSLDEDARLAFYFIIDEFGEAYDKFIDDPNKKFREIVDSMIRKGMDIPSTIKAFEDGQVLLLKSYEKIDGEECIKAVHICDKIKEHSFKIDSGRLEAIGIDNRLKPHLIDMVNGFKKFTEEYLAYSTYIKSK